MEETKLFRIMHQYGKEAKKGSESAKEEYRITTDGIDCQEILHLWQKDFAQLFNRSTDIAQYPDIGSKYLRMVSPMLSFHPYFLYHWP